MFRCASSRLLYLIITGAGSIIHKIELKLLGRTIPEHSPNDTKALTLAVTAHDYFISIISMGSNNDSINLIGLVPF